MGLRRNRSSRPSRSSNGRRSRKPPDVRRLPPFFLDADVDGDQLAAALRRLGLEVKRSREQFPRGTEDVEWLPEVAARGWTLLSADRRQKRKPEELAILKRTRMRAFYFSTSQLTAAQQIEAFTKGLGQIVRAVRKQAPPFTKRIRPRGKVEPLA